MLSEILTNIFGNITYDVIKNTTSRAFGKNSTELELRTQKAIESAIKRFFEKYRTQFGKESQSFLARQENWLIIAQSLRHDKPKLTVDQINPIGFNDSPIADSVAVQFFIDVVEEEFGNDFFLNLLLSVKESIEISNENRDKLLNAIESLTSNIVHKKEIEGEYKVKAYGGDLPPQVELEEGKFYVRNLTRGVKLTYMRRGRKIYSEAYMDNGDVMYCEIDENAIINVLKPPFPVSPHIPPEYYVKQEIIEDEKGRKKLIIYGKYGLRIEAEEIQNGQFGNIKTFNSTISFNSKDKSMVIKPNGVG